MNNLLLPIVVILAVTLLLIVFREPVQRRIEHVQSISFLRFKIVFQEPAPPAQTVEAVGNQAVASSVGAARTVSPADEIEVLARRDPSAAIAASWRRVEEALHLATLRVFSLTPDPQSFSLRNNHLLHKGNYIDDETFGLVTGLWLVADPQKTRNPPHSPTPDEAIEFDRRARIVTQRLSAVEIGRLYQNRREDTEP